MEAPFKNVKLVDLRELAPDICIESSPQTVLEALLFTLGIDIGLRYDLLTGLFRDSELPSKVVTQVYWQGVERSDKAWRVSGRASDELVDSFRSRMNRSSKEDGLVSI